MRKSQFSSLNFVINSTFRTVFDTRSQDVVDVCLEMFNCVPADRGATTAEKLRGTKVWVQTPRLFGSKRPACAPLPARGRAGGGCGSPPPAVGVRGCYPGKFLKTHMLNPAFWWLLRSLVGSRGHVYPSKQQKMSRAKSVPKFHSAVVAPMVVKIKNQSNGNYETCKLHATRHLGP